jgi:hypothetical protein
MSPQLQTALIRGVLTALAVLAAGLTAYQATGKLGAAVAAAIAALLGARVGVEGMVDTYKAPVIKSGP